MPIPLGLIQFGQAAGPWATLASFTGSVLMKIFENDRIEKKLDEALKILRDVQEKVNSINIKCDEILKKLDEVVEKISTKIDIKALQEHYHVLDSALETAALLMGRDGHFAISDEYWSRLYASLLALFEDEWRIAQLAHVHCHAVFMTALTEGKLKPIIDTRIRRNILPLLDRRIGELRKALEKDCAALEAALDDRKEPFALRGIIDSPNDRLPKPMPGPLASEFETAFTRTGTFTRIEHNFGDTLTRMADFAFNFERATGDAWNEPQRQIVHAMIEWLGGHNDRPFDGRPLAPFFVPILFGRRNPDATWLAASVPVTPDMLTATKSVALARRGRSSAESSALLILTAPDLRSNAKYQQWAWTFLIGHVARYNGARYQDWFRPRLATIRATAPVIASNTDMLIEAMAIRKMFESYLEAVVPVTATTEVPCMAVVDNDVMFGLPFAMLSEPPQTRDIPLTGRRRREPSLRPARSRTAPVTARRGTVATARRKPSAAPRIAAKAKLRLGNGRRSKGG